jgi:Tfp pilus assembly protein PilZ
VISIADYLCFGVLFLLQLVLQESETLRVAQELAQITPQGRHRGGIRGTELDEKDAGNGSHMFILGNAAGAT